MAKKGNGMGKATRTKDFPDGGYEQVYEDGTRERVRFTKTREVHDFTDASGEKVSVWQNTNDFFYRKSIIRNFILNVTDCP